MEEMEKQLGEKKKQLEEMEKQLGKKQTHLEEMQKQLEEMKKQLAQSNKEKKMLEDEKAKRDYSDFLQIWEEQKYLVYYLIKNFGCILFGGAVAQYILYDHWLPQYVKICKSIGLDIHSNYFNSAFHPESFSARTKLPRDYDFYIRGDVIFQELITYLQPLYDIANSPLGGSTSSFTGNSSFVEKKKNLIITPKRGLNTGMKLDIQILKNCTVPTDYSFLTKTPDFFCNSLYMVISPNNKIKLESYDTLKGTVPCFEEPGYITEITRQIINYEAKVYVSIEGLNGICVTQGRLVKMRAKGYKITFDQHIIKQNITNSNEKCYICYEEFKSSDTLFKPCCSCNSFTHLNCIAVENLPVFKECGTCRKHFSSNKKQIPRNVFEILKDISRVMLMVNSKMN